MMLQLLDSIALHLAIADPRSQVLGSTEYWEACERDWTKRASGNVVDPADVARLTAERQIARRQLMRTIMFPDDQGQIRRSFMLCNLRQAHYALLEIDPTSRQLYFYDSAGGNGRSEMDKVNELLSIDAADWTPFVANLVTVARQNDAVSCGVYALYNFHRRLHNLHPSLTLRADQLLALRRSLFRLSFMPATFVDHAHAVRRRLPNLIDEPLMGHIEQLMGEEQYTFDQSFL